MIRNRDQLGGGVFDKKPRGGKRSARHYARAFKKKKKRKKKKGIHVTAVPGVVAESQTREFHSHGRGREKEG